MWLRFGSRWKHARQNGKGSCSGAGQCKQLLTSDVSMWVQPQTPRHTQFVGSVRRYQDTNIKSAAFFTNMCSSPRTLLWPLQAAAEQFGPPEPTCCSSNRNRNIPILTRSLPISSAHNQVLANSKDLQTKNTPQSLCSPPVPLSHVSQGSFSTATCGEGKNKAAASMTAQQ